MSIEINYPFDDPSNYTYNITELEVTGGLTQLLLQSASLPFTENFDNDTGFTYDAAKAEFTGGQVQQKDTRPANATLYSGFTVDEDSNWGDGSLVNSLLGGATWDSGRIDLTGVGAKRLSMPGGGGNFDTAGTVGCIRWKYVPNYGVLIGIRNILNFNSDVGNNNSIIITQNGSSLIIDLRDSVGAQHLLIANIGNLTQFQEYIFELNFDFNGTSRFFMDGILKGSLNTSGWTRAAQSGTFFWGGTVGGSDYWLDDVILFNAVQHTSDHAGELPYSYNATIYVNNNVILPEMEHVGPGSILSFASFVTSETGSPKYTLQIGRSGNYLYWNGAAWAISDGSYAQSNDQATFNANVGSLPVSGEKYGQFKIHFPDSNTNSSVSTLTANMIVNTGYLTTNPKGVTNTTFRADAIEGFTVSEVKSGSDEVKYILSKDSQNYYWNGSSWVVSNGTYSQANTAIEINTNKASLFTDGIGAVVGVSYLLHSDDGSTTPQLKGITIQYNFSGVDPTLIEATIWGWYYDIAGTPLNTKTIKVQVTRWLYGTRTVIDDDFIEATINSEGYFEVVLKYEDDIPTELKWVFGDNTIITNFKAGISRFKELMR